MKSFATIGGEWVQLSPREQDVGRLLAHGGKNKDISHQLGITVSTVKGHIARMTTKLGLANRVQLGVWIAQHPESVAGLAVNPALVLPFPAYTRVLRLRA
jgi:DNA-binding NarL/FixJ family response regulator